MTSRLLAAAAGASLMAAALGFGLRAWFRVPDQRPGLWLEACDG